MSPTFRAMGTMVSVVTKHEVDPAVITRATAVARTIFEREEQRFSRFRDDSELSMVNRSDGGWIDVSGPFAAVVMRAIDGAAATDGSFDPTVLAAMVAAGYERDFREIRPSGTKRVPSATCGRWRDIAVDRDRIYLPAGVALDLGGLVKGWTADLSAEAAVDAGLPWAIVNAGGDLRTAGACGPVDVGIEEPSDPSTTCCVVRIDGGALATSSVTHRRWGAGMHHLIDPATGLPARTPALQATVWAPTCAEAEIWSTRAILEGTSTLYDRNGVVVLASGEIVTNLTVAEAA